MIAKSNPLEFVVGGVPGVSAGTPMPEDLDAIPAWYEREYQERIWKPKQELLRLNAPEANPGRTWRLGLAAETFGVPSRFVYYPGGVPGNQVATPAKSKRVGKDRDVRREGEFNTAPFDPSAALVEKAIEEPGILAGSSAKINLPVIQGEWKEKAGYVWCPLRVRMDLDRVHRQLVASGCFVQIHPLGSGGGPYKESPWGHMTPFKSGFTWLDKQFQCGVTDEGNSKKSTSGARLYLTGPPREVSACFNLLISMLPQSDFDNSKDNVAMCLLKDGRSVKWAGMAEAAVFEELGLPPDWARRSNKLKREATLRRSSSSSCSEAW
ncbi:MAG: hypothetical protein ACOVO0_16985, partial [Burkholderiaceae bacterium]